MPAWTDQEQRAYQVALEAGMMPTDIEAALRDARAAKQYLPDVMEVEYDAKVTDADIATAKVWWYYQDAVPDVYKRLLMAGEDAT